MSWRSPSEISVRSRRCYEPVSWSSTSSVVTCRELSPTVDRREHHDAPSHDLATLHRSCRKLDSLRTRYNDCIKFTRSQDCRSIKDGPPANVYILSQVTWLVITKKRKLPANYQAQSLQQPSQRSSMQRHKGRLCIKLMRSQDSLSFKGRLPANVYI